MNSPHPPPPIEECNIRTWANTQVTPDIREWDYGAYEGLTSAQIRERRKEVTGKEDWNIWRDGCEDGEYASSSVLRNPPPVTHFNVEVFFLDILCLCLRMSLHAYGRVKLLMTEPNYVYKDPPKK